MSRSSTNHTGNQTAAPRRIPVVSPGKRVQLRPTPAFELLVVGCGGGPLEGNLSCYLLRQSGQQDWIALEGGSGLGALTQLIQKDPSGFVDFGVSSQITSLVGGPGKAAAKIWENIRSV